MKRLIVLSLLSLYTITASWAQEICNNGRDDDGDGFIDCYDNACSASTFCKDFFLGPPAQCQVTPPAFPQFTMALDFASPNETTNNLARMAIGDLNRDGKPEIITMNQFTKRLFILNGTDGTIQQQATVDWIPNWEVAIANIDNDNCGEIFFFGYEDPPGNNNAGYYIYSYDCNLNFLWRTASRLRGDPINYGLADFDGNGKVELYAKDAVYDAHTGTRLIQTEADDEDEWEEINGGPVAVDIIEGDDRLELVIGLAIYSVDLGNGTANSGSLTLIKSYSDYYIRYPYNATSVADYNEDGYLDVLASGSTDDHGENTTIFFWDVQNNNVITYSDPIPGNFVTNACPAETGEYYKTGWRNGTGRLNIADLDGDGNLNVSYVSGKFLYALDHNLVPLSWSPKVVNEETSGHTGCTLFDFNGDGKSEIVYRDERFLYIINGQTGTIYNQQNCVSRTNREYPIVADVDADGSTELCVTCGFNDQNSIDNFCDLPYSTNSHIRVFKSASDPWVPARRVWNQHGYFNVNVNDDLTIPIQQQKHHKVFSTGSSCAIGGGAVRPLNSFLNQSPFLNIDGCPTYKSPDLAFVDNSLTINPPTCPSQNFTISFQIRNIGDIALSGNVPITFYRGNPLAAGALKLNTITVPLVNLGINGTFSITNATVNGPAGPFTLYIALNDSGNKVPTPITFPNTSFLECNYANNILSTPVNPLPVAITALKVKDNIKCATSSVPDNGAVRAFIPVPTGTENTADYNFYWSIGTVAKPAPADYTGATLNGIAEGTYTVYAIHKTANCSSVSDTVIVLRKNKSVLPKIALIRPYDNCKNPNGELTAIVNDTDNNGIGDPVGNFTYIWYEGTGLITDPQVSVSHNATNLKPRTYAVLVRETATGCQNITSYTVPDSTKSPVVSATPTNAICSSVNSGSATANVGGSTNGFTFYWYNGNGVKASPDFTGVTYANIPAGPYTVVAENNISKCESVPLPVTVSTSPPIVASATVTSHQSSCEPTKPNGSVSANVNSSTAGHNFEWFRGQNTLLANRISTSPIASQLAAGIYTVRATSIATGCSDTHEVTVNSAIVMPTLTLASVNGMTNCTTPDGSISVNVSPDTPADYKFFWYDDAVDGTVDYPDSIRTLSGLPVGTYAVRAVHRTKFCAAAPISASVVDNTPTILINLDASVTTLPSDCSSADGVMRVTVSAPGNTAGFNIQWFFGRAPFAGPAIQTDNGATSSTASGLQTGVYTVVATNLNNGCVASESFDLPFANTHELIFVSKVNVTQCDPADVGSITVELNPTPLAGFDEDDYDILIYSGTSDTGAPVEVIVGVLGDSIYTTNNNLTPGFYTLVAISKNTQTLGCRSVPLLVEIEQIVTYPAIVITQINANSNCSGAMANGRIALDIDGVAGLEINYSYLWVSGTDLSAPPLGGGSIGGSGEIAQNLPAGIYTVQVTNNTTQCASVASAQIFDNPPIISISTADIVLTPITMCNDLLGGAASVTNIQENGAPAGTADYTFRWFDANQNILPNAGTPNTTSTINNLAAGTYFVSVIKNNGVATGANCPSPLVSFQIQDQTIGTINVNLANFTQPTRCQQPANTLGELVAIASGSSTTGYTYNWYAGTTASGPVQSFTANLSNITVPLGQPDVTFTVEAINNTNQCRITNTYVLPLEIVPVLLTTSASPMTSCISENGVVFATVINDNSNGYSYNWDTGTSFTAPPEFSGKQVSDLRFNDYTVVAIDQGDTFCQSTPVTVTVNDERVYPNPTAMPVAPLTICDPARPDGVARVSVDGDVVSYRFDWFSGAPPTGTSLHSGSEFGNLPAATFTVTATHLVTGCSNSTQVTINASMVAIPVPQVNVLSDVTSCLADNGSLGASVNGNTVDFIFHWYNNNPGVPADTASAVFVGEIYSALNVGIYFVSATSRLTGCISAPANGPITEAPIYPDFDFLIDNPSCGSFSMNPDGTPHATGEPTGSLALNMLNNVELASITWFDANGNTLTTGPLLANIEAGQYEVEVIATSGCGTTKTIELLPDINPFNGISRNGDEENPIFHINCIENFPGNKVKIFNRAGTLVYEAEGYDNIDKYFDGRSNKGITVMGNNLPDGTYYYIIDKRDGSKPLAGYLEVVN